MSAVYDVRHEEGALVPRARLELLFDPGTFRPVRTAVGDGVLAGSGRVNGRVVCAWAQDGGFKGGSLGTAGGDTIARTIQRAASLGVPVVGFPHSGGAGCRRASPRCTRTRRSSAPRRWHRYRRSA